MSEQSPDITTLTTPYVATKLVDMQYMQFTTTLHSDMLKWAEQSPDIVVLPR